MAKTQNEQHLYNKLLITQALNYQKLGYTNIKINNKNYIHGQPVKVGGYIPDLSAVFDTETVLCEVVLSDIMNDPKILERWRTISRSGFDFHMITPKKNLNEVKDLVKQNGINVDKFWYSKY